MGHQNISLCHILEVVAHQLKGLPTSPRVGLPVVPRLKSEGDEGHCLKFFQEASESIFSRLN